MGYLVGPKCHYKYPYRDRQREISLTERGRMRTRRKRTIKRIEDAGLGDLSDEVTSKKCQQATRSGKRQ